MKPPFKASINSKRTLLKRLFRKGAFFFAIISFIGPTYALSTNSQVFTYNPPNRTWNNQTFQVPQFNPDAGSLVAVDFDYAIIASCPSLSLRNANATTSRTITGVFTNVFTLKPQGYANGIAGRCGFNAAATVSKNSSVVVSTITPSVTVHPAVSRMTSNLQSYTGAGTFPVDLTWLGADLAYCGSSSQCSDGSSSETTFLFSAIVTVSFVYEPFPPFSITGYALSPAADSVSVDYETLTGSNYIVEATSTLPATAWNVIGSLVASNAISRFSFPTTSSDSNAYVRIRLKTH